jgi:hypothetical protein
MGARHALAALLIAVPAAAAAQDRYIPLELILGAPWSGAEALAYPAGTFREKVAEAPSVWTGPREWTHPRTGETLRVYARARASRRSQVDQIFAVRRDGTAIGRVADSRFGIEACDQEGKYPLGRWTQGESRAFDYTCWYDGAPRARRALIEILRLDFDCRAASHCLQIRWTHSDPVAGRMLDMRVYTFAPGLGMVALD